MLGAEERLDLGMIPEAEDVLSKLPPSPDTNNARAVAAMARGQREQALVLLDEILAAKADHPQAHWNRALLLDDLGLQASAAKAFSDIAAQGEEGWSGEALERATVIESARRDRVSTFAQARATVLGDGELKPPPGSTPSQLRHLFYEALRIAQSPEAATRLQPLTINFSDRAALDAEIKRVAALDLQARKPYAVAYRALIEANSPPPRPEQDTLIASWRKAGETSLIAGASLYLDRETAWAEDLGALAKAQRDPWAQALSELAEAKAERAHGDNAAAARRLKPAVTACNLTALDYPCARLEIQLAAAQGAMGQPSASQKVIEGLRRALRAKLTPFDRALLEEAAEASRSAGATHLADAIAQEAKLPPPAP